MFRTISQLVLAAVFHKSAEINVQPSVYRWVVRSRWRGESEGQPSDTDWRYNLFPFSKIRELASGEVLSTTRKARKRESEGESRRRRHFIRVLWIFVCSPCPDKRQKRLLCGVVVAVSGSLFAPSGAASCQRPRDCRRLIRSYSETRIDGNSEIQ